MNSSKTIENARAAHQKDENSLERIPFSASYMVTPVSLHLLHMNEFPIFINGCISSMWIFIYKRGRRGKGGAEKEYQHNMKAR